MAYLCRRTVIRVAIPLAVVLTGVGTLFAVGGHTARVKQTLTATSMAPNANGKARLTLRGSRNGKFAIMAKHLSGNKQYDVIVAGVKVGIIKTSSGGNGHALFKTQPGGNHSLLGFDPRGGHVMVRDEESGDDVLVGDMPDDDDPTAVACCLSDDHDGEVECEEMSPEECAAAGGTQPGVPGGTAAASCLPNPCDGTPPPNPIVCCTNESHDDESEAECKQVSSEHDCAEEGGAVVQAASCDPNPCQGTPPPDAAACCRADHEGETECEVVSAAACTASGGTPAGVASCHPDPCGGDDGDGGDDGGGDDGGDD